MEEQLENCFRDLEAWELKVSKLQTDEIMEMQLIKFKL
jgi:hypothetical protein